jgi:hypothetical protein
MLTIAIFGCPVYIKMLTLAIFGSPVYIKMLTLTIIGSPVYDLCFTCSQRHLNYLAFKYFGFDYLMKVIPETRRLH